MNRRNFLAVAVGTALFAALPAFGYTTNATYSPTKRQRGSTVRNVRDYGAVGDGVHDDTAAFNQAIASLPTSGGTVNVPAGTYLIDPYRGGAYGIKLRSYMLLNMDPQAILKSKTVNVKKSRIINIPSGLTQVEVAGGQIRGERATHVYASGTTDEWNMGISISGANHVTIRDLWVGNCTGDGICTGGGSTDLEIVNIVSTNNRRQGLSITHSYNVKVYDSEFSYTKGTKPECGIDIEPDPPTTATDIVISNCNLSNNNANGLLIYKRVSRVTVRACKMMYNYGYGVYTVDPDHGEISGNTIEHQGWCGVYFGGITSAYSIFGNTFANNRTRKQGLKMNLGTPVAKTGASASNIELASTTKISLGSNWYCTAT